MLYIYQKEIQSDLNVIAEAFEIYQSTLMYKHKKNGFTEDEIIKTIEDAGVIALKNIHFLGKLEILKLSLSIPSLYDFLYTVHLNWKPENLHGLPIPEIIHPLSFLDMYLWKESVLYKTNGMRSQYQDVEVSSFFWEHKISTLPPEYFNLDYLQARYTLYVENYDKLSYAILNQRLKELLTAGKMEHQKEHDFYNLIQVFGHLDVPLIHTNMPQTEEITIIT